MNVKKSILFLVGGSYVGGAEITNFNLIRDLHQQGYKVLVIVSGWNDGDFIQRLTEHDIPYKSIKLGFLYLTKPLWTLDSLIHYPRAFFQLKNILSKFNPNFVFHCSYRSYLMGYYLFSSRCNIYREHNNPKFSKLNVRLYRFLAKKIKYFICPSEAVKNSLLRLTIPAENTSIIPSPLDPEFACNNIQTTGNNTKPRVGIIGQIHREKGFDFLFNELSKIESDFELYIYGNDKNEFANSLKASISQKIKPKIKWMGYVRDRLEIYKHLDIVIFPSLSESFGRIVLEAGAFSIPVIASDLECFKENIKHGETGFLFRLSNTEELPQFLEQLIIDSSMRKLMGKNARDYILHNFSSEKCTDLFKEIIRD